MPCAGFDFVGQHWGPSVNDAGIENFYFITTRTLYCVTSYCV